MQPAKCKSKNQLLGDRSGFSIFSFLLFHFKRFWQCQGRLTSYASRSSPLTFPRPTLIWPLRVIKHSFAVFNRDSSKSFCSFIFDEWLLFLFSALAVCGFCIDTRRLRFCCFKRPNFRIFHVIGEISSWLLQFNGWVKICTDSYHIGIKKRKAKQKRASSDQA